MKQNSRICATIDLDAIASNIEILTGMLGKETKLLAIIKADGYGHGAVPIARILSNDDRVWGYGVATVQEACELRQAQIRKPILLLGYTFAEDYEDVVDNDLTPTVFSFSQAVELANVARDKGKTISIHIAIDTGMNRIGFADDGDSIGEIDKIVGLENVFVEGIFTHFAKADELEKQPTKKQLERFEALTAQLIANGITIPLQHCSNSAGIMQFPEAHKHLVRAGISIYGLHPSAEMKGLSKHLEPAMRITSHITHVKTIKVGEAVSYGGTYVADKERVVATIPVGYADGYARSLSNKGYVLIAGRKALILGRICMDQFMVDISEIPGAKELDEVVLLGSSGDETITMENLGDISGKFNYEFACGIGKRVPRVYKQNK